MESVSLDDARIWEISAFVKMAVSPINLFMAVSPFHSNFPNLKRCEKSIAKKRLVHKTTTSRNISAPIKLKSPQVDQINKHHNHPKIMT